MSIENWRPIPDCLGYEVSDLGRVRSLDRFDSRGSRAWGRVLSPDVRPSGHLRVTLRRDGRNHRMWVHHLVLLVFIGPRPNGTETCHNDGNPANNAVGNLRWDTKSANARDRRRHGRDANGRKTHCPSGHEYSAENTYLSAKGHRHCKTCVLAGQRRSYVNRKAA